MISVLICDDEKNIREGLKFIIDWNEYGFEIKGEAANSDEALSKINTLKPDLVLMDIRMPGMEGLDVIKTAKLNGFKGKFIIISGFSDFSYAKEAIKLGVNTYITKPVDEDELLASIIEIKNSLKSESENKEVLSNYKNRARSSILLDILYNRLQDKNFIYSDIGLDAKVYQVLVYENLYAGEEKTNYTFADLLKVTNQDNNSYELLSSDNMDIIILKGSFAMDRFKNFLKHYDESAFEKGSLLDSIFVAYGRPVLEPEKLHTSFEDVLRLLKRRFFCLQGQHTLGFEELPDKTDFNNFLSKEKLSDYAKEITEYILTFNRKKVAETLYQLEQYLFNVDDSSKDIKLSLADMYFQIKEKLKITYPDNQIPFPSNADVIDFCGNTNYLYEMIEFLSAQAETVMNSTGSSSKESIFDDILYYINHNYKTNLKLESIAPLFGYNSAYLGKIFSKNVGENFNSYVDHVRIEKSKELLSDNKLKVYEVAETVGYKNVDYFHKKFKKYEGLSPAEYRRAQGGNDIG